MCPRKKNNMAGFTLAELIVASSLLTLVMISVYSGFHASIRAWRDGEASLQTYQHTRIATAILTRELQCVVSSVPYLFEGKDDEIEFFAAAPPLDVDEGNTPRILWIRYRLKVAPKAKGSILLREEAIVEGPLPIRVPDSEKPPTVKKGKEYSVELLNNVLDFDLTYYWTPQPEPRLPDEPPTPVELVKVKENRRNWGIPQGIQIALTVVDNNSPKGETTFTTFVAFRGPTTKFNPKRIRGEAAG